MLLIVPFLEIPAIMSIHKRLRSRPASLSSPNSTPEDMCSRSRIGVLPYSVPLNPGTYVSGVSSTDLIAPSEIAMPINIPMIDLTIDWEMNRS